MIEVVTEDLTIKHVNGDGGQVGKRGVWGNGVEKTRIVLGDVVLLDGTTRRAGGDREFRKAVLLDEAVLDHHRGLGRNDVIRSGSVCVAGAKGNRKTKTQWAV